MERKSTNLSMPSLLLYLILFVASCPPAFASSHGADVHVEMNPAVKNFMSGKGQATPEALVEILKVLHSIPKSASAQATRVLTLLAAAEEIANQIPQLDDVTRKQLTPLLTILLRHFTIPPKHDYIVRIMNRHWLWAPEQLPYMAHQIRNSKARIVSTQVLWALNHASTEQREEFFALSPFDKSGGRHSPIAWFAYALALKYGQEVDEIYLSRLLRSTSRENLRPVPAVFNFNGQPLPTSLDLYDETLLRLQMDTCNRTLE